MLMKEHQEDFYDSLLSRTSNHRYFELWHNREFVGLGGVTNIQWENRIGEISLLIVPGLRGTGIGKEAVAELYRHAFYELNLNCVYGECYDSNPIARDFWYDLITTEYQGDITTLTHRKYWDGKYHNSLYFSVTKAQYEKFIQQTGD